MFLNLSLSVSFLSYEEKQALRIKSYGFMKKIVLKVL